MIYRYYVWNFHQQLIQKQLYSGLKINLNVRGDEENMSKISDHEYEKDLNTPTYGHKYTFRNKLYLCIELNRGLATIEGK